MPESQRPSTFRLPEFGRYAGRPDIGPSYTNSLDQLYFFFYPLALFSARSQSFAHFHVAEFGAPPAPARFTMAQDPLIFPFRNLNPGANPTAWYDFSSYYVAPDPEFAHLFPLYYVFPFVVLYTPRENSPTKHYSP